MMPRPTKEYNNKKAIRHIPSVIYFEVLVLAFLVQLLWGLVLGSPLLWGFNIIKACLLFEIFNV